MRETLRLYLRLAGRTFFGGGRDRPRPSAKRVLVMVVFLPAFAVLQGIHWLAFLVDEWLFPRYREVNVEAPLFIVGVPRSGTTHLHRVLARDEDRYTWFTLWELVFAPAIIERRIVGAVACADRRLGRPLERTLRGVVGLCTGGLDAVHKLALEEPEEDFLLFLPVLACFILVPAFPHDPEITDLAYFDQRLGPERRRRLMAFYRAMLQRHLYAHGENRVMLSKNVSFTPLLGSVLETFPDARLVVCTREPAAAVPSQISSMKASWRLFGNDTTAGDFTERWVRLMCHYYRCQRDILLALPRERALLIDMSDLTGDLETQVRRLYEAFDLILTPEYEARLQEEAAKARGYRSKHAYSIENWGLDAERIERECADLYDGGRDPRDAPAMADPSGPLHNVQ
jgi:hypothetical protein